MAVKVKGTLMPVCVLLTAMVPVYSSNGRFEGGLNCTVTVDDAPGASDGTIAGEASDMYDVAGTRTWRSPLGSPPLLTTVKERSDCVPTTIPEFRKPGL